MKFNDLITVSVRQVVRHRRRYLGAVLAIALGVAGFIVIITMSREVKKNINNDLDLIGGVNIIRVGFDNNRAYRPQWFRQNTVAALGRVKGVKDMSLSFSTVGRTNWHGENFRYTLVAVDDNFWQVFNYWPRTGNLFDAAAVTERKREAVLGVELARKIFGTLDVRGRFLEINHEFYRISGVLGGVTNSNIANAALLPLTTAEDRLVGGLLPDMLYLRCRSWDDVPRIAALVPNIIKANQSPESLHVEVSWEALKRVRQLAWWIESLVYLATTATFLLGGVGIWNVMMAAVVTRTREIGLKKAMGAEDKDILAQFLSEALCLSIGASFVGALAGRILMGILGHAIGCRPPENLFLLGLALATVFSVIIGVGAGLYPSIRASRMEVVSAIRYE